jgi:hypothetical protein
MHGTGQAPNEAGVLLARIIKRHAALIEGETRHTFMRYFKPVEALESDNLEELHLYDRFMTADTITGDMDEHYVYLESRGVSASAPELTLEFFQGCVDIENTIWKVAPPADSEEFIQNKHELFDLIFPDGALTDHVVQIMKERKLFRAEEISNILSVMCRIEAPLREGSL